ncbi:hypothetical protein Taro_055851, partial [Colocasia esculenta]|nr:hypothetical protein [Colocasia esculenta]
CVCGVVEALLKGGSVGGYLVMRHLGCRYPGGDASMHRLQELLKATAPMSPSWTLSRPVQKGCAGLSVAILIATPYLSPSQTEKGLRHLLSVLLPLRLDLLGTFPARLCQRVLLQAAGFARVVDFGRSRGKLWGSDVVVCGALLAETGETSQQFPPLRSEETGPQ